MFKTKLKSVAFFLIIISLIFPGQTMASEAKPNLKATGIWPMTGESGENLVTVYFKNDGDAAATRGFKIKALNETSNNAYYKTADFDVNSGEEKTVTIDVGKDAGTFTFLFTIDSDNAINESSETDNTFEHEVVFGSAEIPVDEMPAGTTLSIISPQKGDVWKTWETYKITIEHNIPSTLNSVISIDLIDESGQHKTIVDKVKVLGYPSPITWEWQVPVDHTLAYGTETRYRLIAYEPTNSAQHYDYSEEFSIISTQIPELSISPTTLTQGESYSFSGTIFNSTPNSEVKLYIQRPDGSMKEDGITVGTTNHNGYLLVTTAQTISSGQNGTYKTWVVVSGQKSNVINFNLSNIDTEEQDDAQIISINEKAELLYQNKTDMILSEIKQSRDAKKEQENEIKYLKSITENTQNLSDKTESIINDFITYGVDENTKKLGEGERAAVIHSFKSAYNKLPETKEELSDAIKIANGRFPSSTSDKAEKTAKEQFKKIYKRIPDMNDAKDSAAIKVMAYGLRQKAENRNLNSEKNGINTFKSAFKYSPKTTEDWNVMQAITYSGATRKKDSDKDLVPDEMEDTLGTNPNNADTDNDGFTDGIEVENNYNPRGAGKIE